MSTGRLICTIVFWTPLQRYSLGNKCLAHLPLLYGLARGHFASSSWGRASKNTHEDLSHGARSSSCSPSLLWRFRLWDVVLRVWTAFLCLWLLCLGDGVSAHGRHWHSHTEGERSPGEAATEGTVSKGLKWDSRAARGFATHPLGGRQTLLLYMGMLFCAFRRLLG